jgi:hypothetical protein
MIPNTMRSFLKTKERMIMMMMIMFKKKKLYLNGLHIICNVPLVSGWMDRRALVNKATFPRGPPVSLCFCIKKNIVKLQLKDGDLSSTVKRRVVLCVTYLMDFF